MTHIILKDDRQSAPALFLLHRLIRIVPMDWLAVFILVFFSNLGLLNLAATMPALLRMGEEGPLRLVRWLLSGFKFFSFYRPEDLLKTVLFIPYKNVNGDFHPVLGVGWTLNLEMFFYTIYAFSLFARKLFAPVIAAVSVALIWSVGRLSENDTNSWFGLYASAYVPYFVAGILTYYAWRMMDRRVERRRLAWMSVALLVFYISAQFGVGFAHWPAPVALVLAALLAHSAGKRVVHPLPLLLGAASYSLYLFHPIILEMFRTLRVYSSLFDFGSSLLAACFVLLACILVSRLLYQLIDKPLLGTLRPLLPPLQ